MSRVYLNRIEASAKTGDILFNSIDKNSYNLGINKSVADLMDMELNPLEYKNKTIDGLTLLLNASIDVFIDSIYIYSENSNYVISSSGEKNYLDDFSDNFIQIDIKKKLEQSRSILLSRKKPVFWGDENTVKVLSKYYSIPLLSKEKKGLLVVNIKADKFLKEVFNISQDMSISSEKFYILDYDGLILHGSEQEENETNLTNLHNIPEAIILEAINKTSGYYVSNNFIFTFVKSSKTGLIYLSALSTIEYEQKINNVLFVIYILILVNIIVILILAFIVSYQIYNPVRNLISILDSDGRNSILGLEKNEGMDEIKYLSRNLINTIDHRAKLEKELLQKMYDLRISQVEVLQAQINPHFLRNTLATISWLAAGLTTGENEVTHVIGLLNNMLSISISKMGNLISLEEEISHACRYVEIQKYRFLDMFEVHWEIPAELYNYKLIKISLQPLIENSIHHGIKPKKSFSRIIIAAREEGGNIILSVHDTGLGLSPMKLEKLNKGLGQDFIESREHIGLFNVHKRYRILFGKDYGVHIKSSENHSTTVTIVIPKIK
ncbi:MAG: histidine kinase [Bacteroidetes bacterium]|nr:histidine kinase [Bacteroidota bacterium]